MAGLSPAHLLIILVIALVVIGPGKLPEVGAAIGKSIREFQKATGGMQGDLLGSLTGGTKPQQPAQPPQIPPSMQSSAVQPAPPPSYPPQPGYVPAATGWAPPASSVNPQAAREAAPPPEPRA
ncbi:MAG: Sec-independent protein translocase subunit TatA/TatB [Candidatus Limnocylindrales bacterium]